MIKASGIYQLKNTTQVYARADKHIHTHIHTQICKPMRTHTHAQNLLKAVTRAASCPGVVQIANNAMIIAENLTSLPGRQQNSMPAMCARCIGCNIYNNYRTRAQCFWSIIGYVKSCSLITCNISINQQSNQFSLCTQKCERRNERKIEWTNRDLNLVVGCPAQCSTDELSTQSTHLPSSFLSHVTSSAVLTPTQWQPTPATQMTLLLPGGEVCPLDFSFISSLSPSHIHACKVRTDSTCPHWRALSQA